MKVHRTAQEIGMNCNKDLDESRQDFLPEQLWVMTARGLGYPRPWTWVSSGSHLLLGLDLPPGMQGREPVLVSLDICSNELPWVWLVSLRPLDVTVLDPLVEPNFLLLGAEGSPSSSGQTGKPCTNSLHSQSYSEVLRWERAGPGNLLDSSTEDTCSDT